MNRRDGSQVGTSDPAEQERLSRRRHTLVVGLTFVTGSADAMGFLMLGGAFSSVMTGNMVLFGLSIGRADTALATTSATAILSYVVGVVVGARVAGVARADDPTWPRAVTRALTVELTAIAALLILWEATIGHRPEGMKLLMLAIAAAALGIQGSAVQRFGISGLSSTYLTGTLTTVIGALATRRPLATVLPSLKILGALIVGAGVGAVVTTHLEPAAPALLVVPLGMVVLEASRISDRGGGRSGTSHDPNSRAGGHIGT